ncbi:LIC11966 family surface protein [Parachryseolinea silvisoli]|jgi:hypothetical protein|uniref:LIC11966 family surface protein n=1 Tax=Parachryseolinea silvisoli TaxID=2873601 RepID=UPI0022658E20|nr:hypothetical protein [Parachryseolinea silvisoli]MCD9019086.1 hypothetical protein [Parachryseolinea silvisoli]
MTHTKLALTVALISLTLSGFTKEQPHAAGTAVEHMAFLSDLEETLSEKYMSYMSEVAHGGRARKMDKRRQDLIAAVRTSITQGNKLKPFEGDATLKTAYVQYWNVLLSVFNEDYRKIVDMEEIAERSYDEMEAYLLMQEKAGDRLDEAYNQVSSAYRTFAEKHNVRLSESQSSKLTRKLQQTGKVNSYVNKMYLLHFKSTVQEGNMITALNNKDVNGMEQSREAMKRYADEGLSRLDTIKGFKGDGSLVTACRKILEFQVMEAGNITALSDFMIKSDDHEKARKTFEAKPAAKRTQADIDTYNKSVNTYNQAVQNYTKVNDDLNKKRTSVLNNWDNSRKRFMDSHVPHK